MLRHNRWVPIHIMVSISFSVCAIHLKSAFLRNFIFLYDYDKNCVKKKSYFRSNFMCSFLKPGHKLCLLFTTHKRLYDYVRFLTLFKIIPTQLYNVQ